VVARYPAGSDGSFHFEVVPVVLISHNRPWFCFVASFRCTP
jgi:hypothetical protein